MSHGQHHYFIALQFSVMLVVCLFPIFANDTPARWGLQRIHISLVRCFLQIFRIPLDLSSTIPCSNPPWVDATLHQEGFQLRANAREKAVNFSQRGEAAKGFLSQFERRKIPGFIHHGHWVWTDDGSKSNDSWTHGDQVGTRKWWESPIFIGNIWDTVDICWSNHSQVGGDPGMICSNGCWLGLFTIGIIIITWVTGYRIQLLKGTEISTNWLVNLGELGRTPSWLGDKDHHQITIFSYHLVVLFRQPLKELESEVCIQKWSAKDTTKDTFGPNKSRERLIQIEGGRTMWNHHFLGHFGSEMSHVKMKWTTE